VAVPEVLSPRVNLPPFDARLTKPGERFETPVDHRGLVLLDLLIHQVKATVDPSYEWPAGKRNENIHHFYHPWRTYSRHDFDTEGDLQFHNLPIHKAVLPIAFHNHLHNVTLPPPVPSEEVRRYRVEAWAVARRLFVEADIIGRYEARIYTPTEENIGDNVDQEAMYQALGEHFRSYDKSMERLHNLPPEFRLVPSDMQFDEAAQRLGTLASTSALPGVEVVTGTLSLAELMSEELLAA
jgi:hypothetical protein